MIATNAFASIALLLWLPLSVVLFGLLRPPVAAGWVILGGILFLPERVSFELQGLPDLGKEEIAVLCALSGCLIRAPRRLADSLPGTGLEILALGLMACSFVTTANNPDPLVFGPVVVPGLRPYDGLSLATVDALGVLLPCYLGRALFRSSRDLADLMRLLVVTGLVYSVLVLVEVRFSPQFHRWIYGAHQHSFGQTLRSGGYRPMVFMPHGLALSLFMLATTLAAVSMARAKLTVFGVASRWAALYLAPVIALCKSMGVVVYALVCVPAAAWASPRAQLRLAVGLALFVLAFPALRITGVFPTDGLVSLSEAVSEDRAASLDFRFTNETPLIERARERVLFGWGSFGRNRIFDPETGQDVSFTDSFWIIEFGTRGSVGLVLSLLIFVVPQLAAWRRLPRIRGPSGVLLAGLCLVLAVYSLDLLLNGLFTMLPVFLAGAVAGLLPGLVREGAAPAPDRPVRPEPAEPKASGDEAGDLTLGSLLRGSGRPPGASRRS